MAFTAVFGGTFNPFHIGHYEMLSALCERQDIKKVLLLPDNVPPHKQCDYLASDEHRIKMCALASEDFPKCELCLIEFEREGKSYTFDTVCLLEKRYPEDKLAFVCGGDMIASLDTWHRFGELIKKISFFAFARDDGGEFLSAVERMRSKGADITVIEKRITDISSSKLRLELDRQFIPKKIYDYICENEVYGKNDT